MPEKPRYSETPEQPLSEQQENVEQEYGRNVKVHAVFVRHGEKETSNTDFETSLTEEGRKGSKEVGEKLREKDLIKAYSSDTERTRETAELIVDASSTKKKMRRVIKQELGFYYDKKGPFYADLIRVKREMLGEDFSELSEEEKKEKMKKYGDYATNCYLDFGDKRPDSMTMSPVETAALMAKRVDVYTKMADRLHSSSDVQLINASHDFNIAAFLKEVMIRKVDDKKVNGFEKIEEIGGPIGFNEGFEVLIETDDNGNKRTKIEFRDQQYELDSQRLSELVKIADDFDYESVEKQQYDKNRIK